MNGLGPMLAFFAIIAIAGLLIWAKRMQRERDLATQKLTGLLPPPPVEDPGLVAFRTELAEQDAWLGQETARAAAWEAWITERDRLIADLKLSPPAILYKIERSLDNIYRTKRLIITSAAAPRHAFNHGDEEAVAKRDSGEGYSRTKREGLRLMGMPYRDAARYIEQKPMLPWPTDVAHYTEHWGKMNDLTFGFLQEAEQWLDDFLNPKGRSWGYGAMGDKVSDMGEPEPVETIESHFRSGERDDEWIRMS